MKEVKNKCGALKVKEDGYCSLPAGHKTNHVNEGRCNLHSDMANGVPTTLYDIPAIKERMQVYLHDPEIVSVDREIALVRAYIELLGNYISILQYEHLHKVKPEDSSINISDLTTLINQCTRNVAHMVQVKHQIEMDRKYMIDIRMVHLIFTMVGEVINKNIIDNAVREAILDSLNRISLPTPIVTKGLKTTVINSNGESINGS